MWHLKVTFIYCLPLCARLSPCSTSLHPFYVPTLLYDSSTVWVLSHLQQDLLHISVLSRRINQLCDPLLESTRQRHQLDKLAIGAFVHLQVHESSEIRIPVAALTVTSTDLMKVTPSLEMTCEIEFEDTNIIIFFVVSFIMCLEKSYIKSSATCSERFI